MTLIRPMTPNDWSAVRSIYGEGIRAGNATFESETPGWEHFDSRKLTTGRLVAVDETGTVLGWVAAGPVSSRSVYRGVVEHSVYVADAAQGRGLGRTLLAAFIKAAEADGIWMIQSSIFPENAASMRLHAAHGFREVGRRERIARSTVGPWAGQWRDTALFERRSTTNGL